MSGTKEQSDLQQIHRNLIWSRTSRITKVNSFHPRCRLSLVCQPADSGPGRTRLERLIVVGSLSTFLSVEALKAAVVEAKTGKDIRRYVEALTRLEAVAPSEPEATRDQVWIDTVDKKNQAETARLETELKGYKNNLIKESIRVCGHARRRSLPY